MLVFARKLIISPLIHLISVFFFHFIWRSYIFSSVLSLLCTDLLCSIFLIHSFHDRWFLFRSHICINFVMPLRFEGTTFFLIFFPRSLLHWRSSTVLYRNRFFFLPPFHRPPPLSNAPQGMNFLAGMLLLFLEPEDSFWGLIAVTEKYFSSNYFDQNLIGAQVSFFWGEERGKFGGDVLWDVLWEMVGMTGGIAKRGGGRGKGMRILRVRWTQQRSEKWIW